LYIQGLDIGKIFDMAYKKDEITLAADVPIALFDEFNEQRTKRNQVKKGAVASAIKLWISLPEEIQARLLNQSLTETAFIELLNEIVDERIEAGRRAGKALRERLKNRRNQKG
jgi:hypothetical protein